MQAEAGIDEFLQDRFGRVRGDFLDLHAARRRRHEGDLAGRAIEHDAEIEFPFDRQRLFDQQPLDQTAFGPGLVRDQRHAENLLGDFAPLPRRSSRL